MSEVPPGCGPHRKAASFRLSPDFNIEQTFRYVKHVGTFNRRFLIRYIDLFAALPPARVAKFLWWARCRPAPIRPTQRLTRPNGAVLSPPSRRRSSLCQQHRDPGIEWTCISSLCPSASRPSKVGPGFRPELRPVYSQTRCLSCSNR